MLIPGLFPQRTIYLTEKSTVTTCINVLQYLDRESTLFHVHNSPIFVRVLNSEILLSHNDKFGAQNQIPLFCFAITIKGKGGLIWK